MSKYREQLEAWVKNIKVNTVRVADIGGASNPVRKRVKEWNVHECVFFDTGVEKAVVDYIPFNINLPIDNQFGGFGEHDIDKTLKFDAIFCLEVFEYVYDPMMAFKNIWQLMNNDSVAYISFPAIYPVHNPIEIDYLRYTENAIKKYLDYFGFVTVEITPRKATEGRGLLSTFYSVEGMHPVRKSDKPFDIGYLVKARKLV